MGKLEVEVEVKSSVDKLWPAVKDTPNLFPKIFPDRYKSVDILQGDGKSAGSVTLTKYAEGLPHITFSKDRIEEVDETNKLLAYSVIDGELLTFYKTFKANLQVVPKGDGSVLKWTVEYEKAAEEIPEPTAYITEIAGKTFEGIDAYLQKL